MRPVLTSSEMRVWERALVEGGVPEGVLLENAGRGAAHLIGLHLRPRTETARKPTQTRGSCVRCADEAQLAEANVLVLAGPGNNGGDAFVVARHLLGRGARVRTFEVAGRTRSDDAAAMRAALLGVGGVVETFEESRFLRELAGASLVVDGLLGIGARLPLEGALERVVRLLEGASVPVFALDVPTGLDADRGTVLGAAIRAEHTIVFGHLKRGLLTTTGHRHGGRLTLAHLGVPSALGGVRPEAWLFEEADVAGWARRRAAFAHKGESGRLLVVGGSPGLEGAPRLAARAAFRAGAGVVTLGSDRGTALVLREGAAETMTLDLEGREEEAFLPNRFSAVALGPGLGDSGFAEASVRAALSTPVPRVLDADALRILGRLDSARFEGPVVLTPHPGEAARLLHCSTTDIEADRFAAVRGLADEFRAVVVLKGSRTLVAEPGGRTLVCALGSASLAVAGSGDVLTGFVGAELARLEGRSLLEAVAYAVGLHALAGSEFEAERGDSGLLAGEIADYALRVRARLTSG